MTTDLWASCLDRFEAHLRAQRAAIESGNGHDLEAFVPDSGLGALPPEHRVRAQRLSAENEALTALLQDARDRVAAAVQRADAPAPAASTPSYLDARA